MSRTAASATEALAELEEVVTEKRVEGKQAEKKGLRSVVVLCTVFISLFVAAMELTVTSTSLATVIESLHGNDFVWVGIAYSLASTAFLPMSGGIAEIFGRRPAMLIALISFALGSVLCGSAQDAMWLIAGRAIQGLGGGAIQSISSIIISDLVTLQERGTYNAIIGMSWAVSSAIGPLVGGALANEGQWRWIFYLNLPICGVAIAAVGVFLDLPTPPGTVRSKLRKMDWIGNSLVISSTTIFVIGLSWAGVVYPWSSYRVLTMLILGFVLFVGFLIYEARFASNPIVPISILSNRSSVSGYIQNFVDYVALLGVGYYFPIYLQAYKDNSVIKSGIAFLPISVSIGVSAMIAGVSVPNLRSVPFSHRVGWVLVIIGIGLFVQLTPQSSYARAVGGSVIPGAGMGVLGAVGYFPVLAPLDVRQNAYALAFFSFGRTFAGIWGISIGGTILQNQLKKRVTPELVQALGGAIITDRLYAFVPKIRFLPEPAKSQMQNAFSDSLRVVWWDCWRRF
ncbi:Mfs1.2 [Marasmius fiardii PR-910]|nr:Mfs1.2 [Marasmius fiardii PR-910]